MEERFDGGLVASRNLLNLRPGELSIAINGIYLPDAPDIMRAPGWRLYATAAATASANYFTGIAGCKMPHNNTSYIVTQDNTGLLCTAAASTGALTLVTAHQLVGSGATSMSPVFYDKKWYLLNGVDTKVMAPADSDIRFRKHGLDPVPAPFSASATVGSAFASSVTGFYEYWYTEVDKQYTSDEIESAYGASDPLTVSVTTTTASPRLTLPKPVNNSATHFRIYRSTTVKTLSTDKLYPSGYAVADVSVVPPAGSSAVTYTDGGTPATVTGFYATFDPTYLSPGWSSASNATGTANVTYARYTRATAYDSNVGGPFSRGQGLFLYSTTATASGNITGFTLSIPIKSSDPSKFQVYVSIGNWASATASTFGGRTLRRFTNLPFKTSFPNGLEGASVDNTGDVRSYGQFGVKSINMAGVSGSVSTATLGGQFDDWLPSEYDWTPTDLTNNFAVLISVVQKNTNVAGGDPGGETLDIDGISFTAHMSGQNAEVGQLYDSIEVTVGGQPIIYPSHGKPPRASTGTIFEGALVTNDLDHAGIVAYSLAGFPDYFPAIYQFPLPEPEVITFIGVVNNRLIAATPTKLYRINYLPTEDDASFTRGRAIELVSSIFGVISPSMACVITAGEGQEELACASFSGLFATDGFTYRSLSTDVRWLDSIFYSTQSLTSANAAALVNHAPTQTLRLFVSSADVATYGHYFAISYASMHRKQGSGVKWSGPVYCYPGAETGVITAAAVITIDSYSFPAVAFKDLTGAGAPNPRIWREGIQGLSEGLLTLPTTNLDKLYLSTRPIPLGGQDFKEGQVGGLYLYGNEASGVNIIGQGPYGNSVWSAPRANVTALQFYPNHTFATTTAAATAVCSGFAAYVPIGNINSNHVIFSIQQASASYQYTLTKLDLVGEDFGEAESG